MPAPHVATEPRTEPPQGSPWVPSGIVPGESSEAFTARIVALIESQRAVYSLRD